jgi:hypothetical protein
MHDSRVCEVWSPGNNPNRIARLFCLFHRDNGGRQTARQRLYSQEDSENTVKHRPVEEFQLRSPDCTVTS